MGRKKSEEMQSCYRFIGAKIQQMRESLGWTQQELADKISLDRTSIVNIENGRQRFMLHDIELFAKVFNSTPKNILRGIWL